MTLPPVLDESEITARQRYLLLNIVRICGIALAIAGIAATRDVLPLPFPFAVVLTLIGVLAFFFAPPVMVKRWKKQDAQG